MFTENEIIEELNVLHGEIMQIMNTGHGPGLRAELTPIFNLLYQLTTYYFCCIIILELGRLGSGNEPHVNAHYYMTA